MIRYIEIGDQICDGENYFAWYNTVSSEFLNLDGMQVWGSWREFELDFEFEKMDGIERYRGLFPKSEVSGDE